MSSAPASDRRMTTAAMAAAASVATSAVLPVFLVGALAVQVRADLGFAASGLGLSVAAFFGAAALGSTPGGRVAERLGPAVAMRVAAVLAALSLALLAISRTLEELLACLVVGGMANALAQPATNLYLARRVGASRLGFAFGVKQSAIPAATLLGGLAVPAIALTVGWRWAFAGAAAIVTVLAIVGPGNGAGAPVIARGARRSTSDAALRPLVVLAVGVGLGAAAAGTLGTFLVSGAVEAGITEGAAGLLASVCSAAGLTTRVVAGRRADRRGGGQLAVVSLMLSGGAAGYACLATGMPALVVVGALVGFCVGWGWPGLFNLSIVRNNPGAPGAATGITQTGTYIGGVVGPLLFGVVADGFSYRAAWLGAGACSVSAAAIVALGRRLLVTDRARRDALRVGEVGPAGSPVTPLGQ